MKPTCARALHVASRRSSKGGGGPPMEAYWAAPATARGHIATLDRPSTVRVPVGSTRAARGGAQQQGDHDASITPIAGCQPDFGSQSIVGCTDCPSEKHSFAFMDLLLPPPVGREKYPSTWKRPGCWSVPRKLSRPRVTFCCSATRRRRSHEAYPPPTCKHGTV